MGKLLNIFTGRRIIFLGLILLVIALAAYFTKPFGLFHMGVDLTKIKTETVKRTDLTTTVNVSGQVVAENLATQGFLTTGRVSYLGFSEGDKVKKGQIIASLDSTESKIAVSKAEASLWSAQSAVEKVADDTRLWNYGNNCPGCETMTQKMNREQAQATRDSAYQELQRAKKALEWSTIIVPFDGTVADISGIAVGQNITPSSQTSITMVGSGDLKFVADVDETEFTNINLGMEGVITLDAYPAVKFTGVVNKIAVSAIKNSSGGSVIPVEIKLLDDQRLINGLNGEAVFNLTGKKGVLAVSKSAIKKNSNGNKYVNIIINNQIAEKKVDTGESMGSLVEILGDINEGDRVVLSDIKQ